MERRARGHCYGCVGYDLAPCIEPGTEEKKMRRAHGAVKRAVALLVPLLLAACAGVPRDASMPVSDPSETMNRHVMAANQEVLRPLSVAVKALPGPVHDRLHDFNSNLREPRILVNNILQGRVE